MSDRPERCEHCHRPHNKTVHVANDGKWWGGPETSPTGEVNMMWFDATGKSTGYYVGMRIYKRPTPKEIEDGYAKGLERKDIRGKEIKLKVSTEFVWLTRVMSRDGKFHRYLCMYCRSIVMQNRKAANAKSPTADMNPLFDLVDIDKKGKALKEQKKKERREARMGPVVDSFGDD